MSLTLGERWEILRGKKICVFAAEKTHCNRWMLCAKDIFDSSNGKVNRLLGIVGIDKSYLYGLRDDEEIIDPNNLEQIKIAKEVLLTRSFQRRQRILDRIAERKRVAKAIR